MTGAGLARVLVPVFVIVLMLVFIYLPVATLILFSLHDGRVPVPPFEGPTLEWYRRILDNPRITEGTISSVLVGIGSSAIAVGLATLAGWGLARHRLPGGRLLEAMILAPLAVSYLVVGVGLMVTYAGAVISKSLILVAIGHVVLNLPLAFAIIYSQFGREQAVLETAARDLGASEPQVFFMITLPSLRVAMVAAFVLCFTFSWDEFIVAFLLAGFDPTLPIVIWSLLRTGLDPQTNAAGSLVFLVSILAALVVELILLGRRSRVRGL
ncbi:MAG: ABC transporter permease [Pseudomonadota bacterium]